MKLKALLKGFKELEIKGAKEIEITGLSADSRTAAPGNLFIAKKGSTLHGAEFIPRAVEAGSAAVLTDLYDPFCPVVQIIAKHPEDWEPLLASRFYGAPSEKLFMVGVTGTKGKTTTTYLIHHLLNSLGQKTGLVGSVEIRFGQDFRSSLLTTHGAIFNQKLLKEMLTKHCTAVSFEVSSHGLAQKRVEGIDFDVAIFTNLYSDHLDYHGSIEEYAAAKKKLFSPHLKRAIFNADNDWTHFMKQDCKCPIWTFAVNKRADIQAKHIEFDENGTEFFIDGQPFFIPLLGLFNVYNALGAVAIGLHIGANLSTIASFLKSIQPAPGRLERVQNNHGIWVFVDHAHTGPALENVLITLKEIARKRVICVFGAGGNRDLQRRFQLAKAAENYSDVSIITSDNPRTEDPTSICEQIRDAYQDRSKPIVEIDRKKAITLALEIAKREDVVLIAGKGHEKMQIFAHQTVPFDDVLVAREILDLFRN